MDAQHYGTSNKFSFSRLNNLLVLDLSIVDRGVARTPLLGWDPCKVYPGILSSNSQYLGYQGLIMVKLYRHGTRSRHYILPYLFLTGPFNHPSIHHLRQPLSQSGTEPRTAESTYTPSIGAHGGLVFNLLMGTPRPPMLFTTYDTLPTRHATSSQAVRRL
ncbi:hypothetical protein PAXINDRAFT_19818 [Paxillus involutus ATCC 200175]|uniref:Uncharacterized protein n=1 Tax=Paxillus involutus ATCC 200175 TaxID=664439 RepID=A0A0C9T6W1_PAXIN|nr:hypothetical protein PAXINDRAFT_19818 [Paxillus involutus ATCC 200175]